MSGRQVPRSSRYETVKRVLDVAVAGVGMALASPLLGVTALAVRRDLGRPILFRQQRPGKDGVPFQLIKFRTMRSASSPNSELDDAGRLTPLGSWLRATSLDELPTLWNVVRGDMSLIGPRPLLMHYLSHYTPFQARRHEVRPGITGLAQTSGRNSLSWDQKFTYDVAYVDRRSLRLDAAILLSTVSVVLSRRGTSAHGHDTMPPFVLREPGDVAGQAGVLT